LQTAIHLFYCRLTFHILITIYFAKWPAKRYHVRVHRKSESDPRRFGVDVGRHLEHDGGGGVAAVVTPCQQKLAGRGGAVAVLRLLEAALRLAAAADVDVLSPAQPHNDHDTQPDDRRRRCRRRCMSTTGVMLHRPRRRSLCLCACQTDATIDGQQRPVSRENDQRVRAGELGCGRFADVFFQIKSNQIYLRQE